MRAVPTLLCDHFVVASLRFRITRLHRYEYIGLLVTIDVMYRICMHARIFPADRLLPQVLASLAFLCDHRAFGCVCVRIVFINRDQHICFTIAGEVRHCIRVDPAVPACTADRLRPQMLASLAALCDHRVCAYASCASLLMHQEVWRTIAVKVWYRICIQIRILAGDRLVP